jgi:hypothetical protein
MRLPGRNDIDSEALQSTVKINTGRSFMSRNAVYGALRRDCGVDRSEIANVYPTSNPSEWCVEFDRPATSKEFEMYYVGGGAGVG